MYGSSEDQKSPSDQRLSHFTSCLPQWPTRCKIFQMHSSSKAGKASHVELVISQQILKAKGSLLFTTVSSNQTRTTLTASKTFFFELTLLETRRYPQNHSTALVALQLDKFPLLDNLIIPQTLFNYQVCGES